MSRLNALHVGSTRAELLQLNRPTSPGQLNIIIIIILKSKYIRSIHYVSNYDNNRKDSCRPGTEIRWRRNRVTFHVYGRSTSSDRKKLMPLWRAWWRFHKWVDGQSRGQYAHEPPIGAGIRRGRTCRRCPCLWSADLIGQCQCREGDATQRWDDAVPTLSAGRPACSAPVQVQDP